MEAPVSNMRWRVELHLSERDELKAPLSGGTERNGHTMPLLEFV